MNKEQMTVPARSPVDDALDRLERACLELWPPLKREWLETVATVREALERLREERAAYQRAMDTWEAREQRQHDRAEAAEARCAQLEAEALAFEGAWLGVDEAVEKARALLSAGRK